METTSPQLPNNTSSSDNALEQLKLLEDSLAVELLPSLLVLTLLSLVGFLGNSVALYVYYSGFKSSSARTYILAMSVFDMLFSALALPGEVLDLRFSLTYDARWLCRLHRFDTCFLTLVSGFILVAVALDRRRKICHPSLHATTARKAKVTLLACTAAAFALAIPFSIMNGRHSVDTGLGVGGVSCSVDDQFLDTLFPLLYNLLLLLVFLLCAGAMAASYIHIARTVLRHKRQAYRVNQLRQGAMKEMVQVLGRLDRTLDSSSEQRGDSDSNDAAPSGVPHERQEGSPPRREHPSSSKASNVSPNGSDSNDVPSAVSHCERQEGSPPRREHPASCKASNGSPRGSDSNDVPSGVPHERQEESPPRREPSTSSKASNGSPPWLYQPQPGDSQPCGAPGSFKALNGSPPCQLKPIDNQPCEVSRAPKASNGSPLYQQRPSDTQTCEASSSPKALNGSPLYQLQPGDSQRCEAASAEGRGEKDLEAGLAALGVAIQTLADVVSEDCGLGRSDCVPPRTQRARSSSVDDVLLCRVTSTVSSITNRASDVSDCSNNNNAASSSSSSPLSEDCCQIDEAVAAFAASCEENRKVNDDDDDGIRACDITATVTIDFSETLKSSAATDTVTSSSSSQTTFAADATADASSAVSKTRRSTLPMNFGGTQYVIQTDVTTGRRDTKPAAAGIAGLSSGCSSAFTAALPVGNSSTSTTSTSVSRAGKLHSLLRTTLRRVRPASSSFNGTTAAVLSPLRRRVTMKTIPSRTTWMMFVLTAIFVLSYLPYLAITCVRAVNRDVEAGLSGWRLNAYTIAHKSYFINSVINPVVYCFCNVRFRQQCRQLFTPRKTYSPPH